MKKLIINQRKKFSQFNREAENNAKKYNCCLCNKKITTHCNSHVVPRFILKQIAEGGNVSYGATFFTSLNEVLDTTKGINNAFTFKMICSDCDKKIFSKYEDPTVLFNFDKLEIVDRKEILSEIAIKCHLSNIWAKRIVCERSNIVWPTETRFLKMIWAKRAPELDVNENLENIEKIKNFKKYKNYLMPQK